jgi:hypothetical protein
MEEKLARGGMTALAFAGMLKSLDQVEDGLERLKQEDAANIEAQRAYLKVACMIVDVRCWLRDAIDAEEKALKEEDS